MKKVIKEIEDAVGIKDIKDYNIYAFCSKPDIYKAHKVGNEWAWIDMGSSVCYANGTFSDLKSLISLQREPVYEFDNIKEFLEWALKQVN